MLRFEEGIAACVARLNTAVSNATTIPLRVRSDIQHPLICGTPFHSSVTRSAALDCAYQWIGANGKVRLVDGAPAGCSCQSFACQSGDDRTGAADFGDRDLVFRLIVTDDFGWS